jgi:tight adherence protein C
MPLTQLIITFLVFASAGVLLVLGLTRSSSAQLSPTERVRRAGQGGSLRSEEEMKRSFFDRVLAPMSDSIGVNFGRYLPGGLTRNAKQLIDEAGLAGSVSPVQVAGFCWLLGIALPVLVFLLYGTLGLAVGLKLLLIVLATMLGFRLPMVILGARGRKRKDEIVRAMPFALDLLSISVGAGVGFDGALQTVVEQTNGPLSDELGRTLAEIRLGKPRNRALVDLGARTGVDDLKRFTSAVAFVSDVGGGLVQVLNVQAEAMRVVRKQRAEEKAMKAPVKMLIPLVFFIFPCLGIVILFPAFYQIMNSALMG